MRSQVLDVFDFSVTLGHISHTLGLLHIHLFLHDITPHDLPSALMCSTNLKEIRNIYRDIQLDTYISLIFVNSSIWYKDHSRSIHRIGTTSRTSSRLWFVSRDFSSHTLIKGPKSFVFEYGLCFSFPVRSEQGTWATNHRLAGKKETWPRKTSQITNESIDYAPPVAHESNIRAHVFNIGHNEFGINMNTCVTFHGRTV